MKRFIYCVIYCIASLALASCSESISLVHNTVKPGDITLNVFSTVTETRAVVGEITGDNTLNENKINTIHYFFYPRNVGNNNTEFQPAYIGKKDNLSAVGNYSWNVNVTEDKLKKTLFPMPYDQCDVYVIVNLPQEISEDIEADPDYDMSLSNLRRIALEANFNTTDPQESFVMEGLGVVSILDRKEQLAARGEIQVDRVAAKIMVDISVESQLSTTDGVSSTDGMVWESMPADMTIELVNGVKTAVLAATPSLVGYNDNTFSTSPRSVSNKSGVWSCVPFYSYPASWDVGSESEPYLKITLPWKTTIYTDIDGQTQPVDRTERCVYKVILGGESLNRNTCYYLDINIGILGSFENEKEVVIPFEDTHYFVADWSKTDIRASTNASIEGARYLILDKYEYNMYTLDELRIPFTSSHVCEIVDMSTPRIKNQATVTYPDYSKNEPNENAPQSWNNSIWHISIDKSEIVFRHALRNDISAGKGNFDYAPYTVKFTIRHSDLDENGNSYGNVYYKDITIIQYPAMVIQCMPNRKLGGNGYGGAWVNGGRTSYGGLRELSGTGGTFSANPNMYVIQTSVLPSDSELIIGDPRAMEPNNLNNTGWVYAPGIEGSNNRTLTNYYPTLTTSDVKNMIAPKFRISSSHSVCPNTIGYLEAQYRCASYQEDGYPAGRWRLPTAGEVQYMILLSSYGVIPSLFTASMNYWCASGIVSGQGVASDVTTGSNVARCVYDEWYWENSEYKRLPGDTIAFTWGDEPR